MEYRKVLEPLFKSKNVDLEEIRGTIKMNKKATKIIFSSDSDEWITPFKLFYQLEEIFKVKFTLDPCSTIQNTKCINHFTIKDNGLEQSWKGHNVFVNPPYSEITKWVQKSYEESFKDNTSVVMLIPSRTDTKYWHKWIMQANSIYFIKSRVKFEHLEKKMYIAPFPSCVVYFNNSYDDLEKKDRIKLFVSSLEIKK